MSLFGVHTRLWIGVLPAFRKSVYLGRVYTAVQQARSYEHSSVKSAPPAPRSGLESKQRPVPRKVRDAIELLCTGQVRTIKAAAERVGLARETLSRRLSRPECIEALKTRAAREVALSSGRAAARLRELIDSASQKVALDATKFSLGVAGIKPASDNVSVNIGVSCGWVIDLSEREPAAKLVSGVAKVIDAKPVE